jgi:hypothetical protein
MRSTIIPRYSGKLAKSIPHDMFRAPTILDDGNFRDSEQTPRLTAVILEKLDALCRYYGVEFRDVNHEHALTLARRYVPGFQIGGGRPLGPRKKWNDIRLAQLWIFFRAARPEFRSDISALTHIAKHKGFQQITGKAKPVWLKQLVEKAKLSPLVQMMESSNPSDAEFAWNFLARHTGEPSIAGDAPARGNR